MTGDETGQVPHVPLDVCYRCKSPGPVQRPPVLVVVWPGGGAQGCVYFGGGGYHIKEEGLHGSRGGRPAGGACAKKDV